MRRKLRHKLINGININTQYETKKKSARINQGLVETTRFVTKSGRAENARDKSCYVCLISDGCCVQRLAEIV